MPKISVIVPIYKAEKYLRRCLDSIVNQTMKDLEIILVNDASPDGSLQILRAYEAMDPRIKVINLPQNGGIANARNAGLKNSTGEFVTFVDDDDYMELDRYGRLYSCISDSTIDAVIDGFYSEKEWDHKVIPHPFVEKEMIICSDEMLESYVKMSDRKGRFVGALSTIWTALYRGTIARKISFLHIFDEDCIYNLNFFLHSHRLFLSPVIAYHAVQYFRSTSHGYKARVSAYGWNGIVSYARYLSTEKAFERIKNFDDYRAHRIIYSFFTLALNVGIWNSPETFTERYQTLKDISEQEEFRKSYVYYQDQKLGGVFPLTIRVVLSLLFHRHHTVAMACILGYKIPQDFLRRVFGALRRH